jgi:hypothetical protein
MRKSDYTHFLVFLAPATFALWISSEAIDIIIQHHGRRFDLLPPP